MSDAHDAPLIRHAVTTIHGRYLVKPPGPGSADLWLVGFHGQGELAESFLEPLLRTPRGPRWLVASIQGLNRFYMGRGQVLVANWMTSQDREIVIPDNVAWVDTVLDRLEEEFGPPRGIVFAGFSQGVAMAYRAGMLCRRSCAAIVAGCGDLPPEFRSVTTREWPRILAATGSNDSWYTPARLASDMEYARARRPDARELVFEGGHEWSNELVEAVGRLLTEVEQSAGT